MERNRYPFVISFRFTCNLNVPVSDVSIAGISPSSGVISWSGLTNATDYDVVVNPVLQTNYNQAENGHGISVIHKPGSTTATVSGLVSGTEYYVSVWAITPVTSFRSNTFVTTQAPSIISFLFSDTLKFPVSNVTVAGISRSSAIISWSAMTNAPDYDVFISPVLQISHNNAINGHGISVIHKPGSTTATVCGLVSGIDYYVSVWESTPVPSFSADTVFQKLVALVASK